MGAAETTHTVAGTVYYDGAPIAGVEVFLSVAPDRYTCTDASGGYSFEGVPHGAMAFAAAGSSVAWPYCDNEKPVNAEGNPIMPGFYEGNDFMVSGDRSDIDIELTPLPRASVILNTLARGALRFHYDVYFPFLRDLYVGAYEAVFEFQAGAGIIRGVIADRYGEYLRHLQFMFGLAAP